jgi:hypothetical protein
MRPDISVSPTSQLGASEIRTYQGQVNEDMLLTPRVWPITRDAEESEESFARRLEIFLGSPLDLLERVDVFEESTRNAGRRAIADLHSVGLSAYYMLEGDPRLVRHDANGRRWFVRLTTGDGDEVLGPVPGRD